MTTNAFWQQGEVQVGRFSSDRCLSDDSWFQTCLSPPTVLEIRLRLGFIRADNHGRWQLEVLDPSGGELLALVSRPHFWLGGLEEELAEVGRRLGVILESYLDPDPFP